MFRKEFIVQLVVEATHQYTVNAVSEEDATSKAEALYEQEDCGTRLGFDVVRSDGFSDDEEDYD